MRMFRRLILLILIISVAVAWLGGIFSVNFSPFSLTVRKPEKDFLKRAANKAKSLIYQEATVHNLPGDLIPDQIDDNIKKEIKQIVN